MKMLRAKSARVSLVLVAFAAIGCGGEKTDFSVPPKSYSLTDIVPAAVGDVVVQGVGRDGRLVGTYLKTSGKPVQPFGWSPDGVTADFTLPTQCKQMDGINEIGQIACSDQSGATPKLYLWQTSAVDEIKLPASTKSVSIRSMSFAAGLAAQVTLVNTKFDGFTLKSQENPVAWTTTGQGGLLGVSQSGNLSGFDQGSGHSKGVVVIDGKKSILTGSTGTDTWANSVNDTGLVVGYTADGTTNLKAFSWQGGTFKTLPMVAGATESVAVDVNNSGLIGGRMLVNGVWQACVWFPGKAPSLLKDLAAVPATVVLNEAKVVTPLGIVIATATKKINGVDHSAVCALTPNY